MLREIYILLKNHLTTNVIELKRIDWDLNQSAQLGEDYIPVTPEAFIGFDLITWQPLSRNVQKSVLTFDVQLISDTAYGDDRDMTDQTYINHLSIESKIYTALANKRFRLSDLPGNEALAGTNNDRIMIESIVRTVTDPHNNISNIISTTQQFQCNIFDYAAQPEMQEILAELQLAATLHKTL